jgi:hypothetical protein
MRRWGRDWSFTSPPGWCDHCGTPATEIEAAELDRAAAAKFMQKAGLKKAGRKPKPPGTTDGARRLAMLEKGMSLEQIADWDAVDDVASVRKSIWRERKRAGH